MTEIDLQEKMFTDFANVNINFISHWHELTQASYAYFLKDVEENNKEEKNYAETLVNGYMKRKMRNFCFIMHMSNFEEISFHTCKKEGITPPIGGSIKRFKEGWSSRIGKSVDTLNEWHVLLHAEELRNCILHACERVSLVKEKKRKSLQNIIDKEKLTVELDRVAVTPEYINKVSNSIRRIINIKKTNP